jgi:hypothetical protein
MIALFSELFDLKSSFTFSDEEYLELSGIEFCEFQDCPIGQEKNRKLDEYL